MWQFTFYVRAPNGAMISVTLCETATFDFCDLLSPIEIRDVTLKPEIQVIGLIPQTNHVVHVVKRCFNFTFTTVVPTSD